jgi:hypothetical protein
VDEEAADTPKGGRLRPAAPIRGREKRYLEEVSCDVGTAFVFDLVRVRQ